LRGCDCCSALMYAEDVFCPTCGAGLEVAVTAAGKVRIPMRRHGVMPWMEEPEGEIESEFEYEERGRAGRGGGVRSAIVGLGLSLVAAGTMGAVIYRLW
jgi:hypothetical protein